MTQTRSITNREIRMFSQTVIPCPVKTAIQAILDYIYPNTHFELAVIKFVTFLEASYQPYMYMLINTRIVKRAKRSFWCSFLR